MSTVAVQLPALSDTTNNNSKSNSRSSFFKKSFFFKDSRGGGSTAATSSDVQTDDDTNTTTGTRSDDDSAAVSTSSSSWERVKVEHYSNQKGGSESEDEEWHVAMEPTVLGDVGNIDEWFDMFLSNDAPYSFQWYQTNVIGDTDIAVNEWKNATTTGHGSSLEKEESRNDDDEGSPVAPTLSSTKLLERTTTYTHPLPSAAKLISGKSIGEGGARTHQHQTWERFEDGGAIFTTTTNILSGSPVAGDCFYVENRWLVEPSTRKEGGGGGGVTVSVNFRIVFVKRTMFRSIVTKNVVFETNRWIDGYKDLMIQETTTKAKTTDGKK